MMNASRELYCKGEHTELATVPAMSCNGIPLVSAIITTHNRGPDMVLRAVNSVLNQTYKNIELIVVDDSVSSFEKRSEVEQSVRGVSTDILYLKHETCQGACAARNTGLRHARGYYVGFLDDDDEWIPTKIEVQLKGFTDDRIALVYSKIIVVDEKSSREYISNGQGKSGYIFESLLKKQYIGSTSNPLIKRECIEAVGNFDVLMESCQDYDLYLRLASRYRMQFIDVPLLRYHIHSEERISTDAESKIQGHTRLIEKYSEYIDKDKDTFYIRHLDLFPYYLKYYGRRKAFTLLISCVKRRPDYFLRNTKLLVRIILGDDLYMATRAKFAVLHRKLGKSGHV
jgi:glycosyltransferase involved in cell wall biosynthesis